MRERCKEKVFISKDRATVTSKICGISRSEVFHLRKASKSTIQRRLKKLGFVCKKRNKKIAVYQRFDVIANRQRANQLRELRASRYKIFYQDETWCKANHTREYVYGRRMVTLMTSYETLNGVVVSAIDHTKKVEDACWQVDFGDFPPPVVSRLIVKVRPEDESSFAGEPGSENEQSSESENSLQSEETSTSESSSESEENEDE